MSTLERLAADDLRVVIAGYRDALRSHREEINRLNVYPVPDGDTGTNMVLTVESVVAELDGADEDMAATCTAISHGSLMGARGNSGVILSQILRGLSATLAEADDGDGRRWAEGLSAAAEAAYGAVMKPVEGTILTVAREGAAAAVARADDGGALVDVLDAARAAAAEALDNTPELLPVLKEAGVVDAGGAGLLLLLDVLLDVVDGRPVPEPVLVEAPAMVRRHEELGTPDHDGVSDLRYEVMYFLEAADEAVPAFKDVWAGIGDSIVVVGGDGIWNCHIHTDDIGAAIEAAVECGRPRQIRVTDLMEQVEEERWVREAETEPLDEPPGGPVPTAVVAVCSGDGIRRIFHSLGARGIVLGGQTMNPSTAELVEAVAQVPGDEVVILPNNKNIIPVAEQVDGQSDKPVRVVATTGVAEGFASLLAYDPEASAADNQAAMTEAADEVVAGEVTQAIRDSSCELGPIKEGDFMGVGPGGIKAVAADLADAAVGLLDAIVTDEHEIVTVIEGDGATAGTTRHLTQWLEEHRPDVEAEIHHGGQPLYPYYFGIE
jgi:DAK2 domain fusion protein YloV